MEIEHYQSNSLGVQLLRKMKRNERTKGRATNVVVPESMKLEKTAPKPPANGVMKILQENAILIMQIVGASVLILLSLSLHSSSSNAIQNLVNANPEALKTAFMGDTPYLFYCHRGNKDEKVPQIFTDLNGMKGSKMGFALVNCSQVLSSGKTIWDRFKLKQEIRPTIFETAPWAKPQQATKRELKDVTALKKFVEHTMAPKGVEVFSEKDLMKHCGFANKTAVADVHSRGETCFVLIKGTQYSKFHADLEERIVRNNPKLRIATIDAVKKRLSFEDPELLPASMFALKIHALRNSTHHMSMVNPLTWDYVSTFISQAVSTPSYSYSGDHKSPIKLMKTGSSAFKKRTIPTGPPSSSPTMGKSKLPKKDVKEPAEKTEKTSTNAETTQATQETVAERFAREKRRRDEMERQSREHLFEDGSSNDDAEEESEETNEDEDDDNVIEL